MAYNESHVCDVAPSPTGARGHVAERRAAAPRSPSRPAGAAMYIRAVIRSARSILHTAVNTYRSSHGFGYECNSPNQVQPRKASEVRHPRAIARELQLTVYQNSQ